MLAIIDYGYGNVRSLQNSLTYIGYDSIITSDPEQIKDAKKLLLPGVGAFRDAINALHKTDLVGLLNEEVLEKKKPVLGICLGMQLMAKKSYEHGEFSGLGWFDSEVVKIETNENLKVPHVGWNNIVSKNSEWLFSGIPENGSDFYFVHSYYMKCRNIIDISSVTNYGLDLTASVCKENITATQFHPEKSQDNGLKLLENWLNR